MVITYFINYNLSLNKISKAVIYVICAGSILNFFLSMNFKYTFDYKEQADGKDCFDRVNKINIVPIENKTQWSKECVLQEMSTVCHKVWFSGEWYETIAFVFFDKKSLVIAILLLVTGQPPPY